MDIPENQWNDRGKENPDRKKDLRETFDLLLPDVLMIALAVIMLPVVLLPLFFQLPDSVIEAFRFIDYAILAIFIIEYLSKAILAPNIVKHVLNPWHLLDLIIIVVPLISLLPMISLEFANSSLILRLLRIIRIVAMGSRTVERRRQLASAVNLVPVPETRPMEIQVMDGKIGNILPGVPFSDLDRYVTNPSQTWVNISSVSEVDFDKLSAVLKIPRILLESELTDEAYPRIDYFESYSLIFARIADFQISAKGAARLLIDRKGFLVICQGPNIITVSKTKTDIFNQITEETRKTLSPEEPLVVTILYTILKHILEKDKQIIAAMEHQLMSLESIPWNKRPDNFLEITFHLRKEDNQLVPSLLHLKEIITAITSKRVPLEGFVERHEKIFDILMDEATYLHETASNARDNLQSLVDLYINTTSFEMTKVMRLIAVITGMGIIPAIILGALGTNISGNPWEIRLWQEFGLVGFLMLIMGWIFYRLGWLKG
jgi:Mg2+ and Co2+ transporter CorA